MKTIARLIVGVLAFVPVFALAPISHADVRCYCVLYVREVLGVSIYGDADTQHADKPLEYAKIGDVILFKYPGTYHVAQIVGFEGEQRIGNFLVPEYISVLEANFTPCKAGLRKIRWTDTAILGVISTPQAR